MEWTEPAIVLGARRQGEGSLVVSRLTRGRGAWRGLVRGAARSRSRGLYEPGNRVIADWKARLPEHLGLLRLEPVANVASLAMEDPLLLACLEAATALAEASLPDRAPHPASYDALALLLQAIEQGRDYASLHLSFEVALLAELGYGLDLAACAVTGETSGLAYVSPRTGRAVSRDAAGTFADRLMVLPRRLGGMGSGGGEARDVLDGLALTGLFLDRHVFAGLDRAAPAARGRYLDRLRRAERIEDRDKAGGD
jgi:DNA repair protein RecO (recombination protein O)